MSVMRARAALLLEVLVSLAILVSVSMAIGAVLRDSTDRLLDVGRVGVARDLARSAIAQIEAGVATPEALNGPVPVWDSSRALAELGDEVGPRSSDEIDPGSGVPEPSGWTLEIETQPSAFEGLTLVSVTAIHADDPRARATLHQLVRLAPVGEEGVGDLDEISREAQRRGGRP